MCRRSCKARTRARNRGLAKNPMSRVQTTLLHKHPHKSISPRPATRTVAPLSDHALALRYAAAQGLTDRDDILERILHGALLPELSYPRGCQGRTEGAQAIQNQRYRIQRACSMELQDLLYSHASNGIILVSTSTCGQVQCKIVFGA